MNSDTSRSAIPANNSANFLSVLQTPRSQVGVQVLITSAAVSVKFFAGSDGKPMTDVSGFAKILDYISSLFNTFKFEPI